MRICIFVQCPPNSRNSNSGNSNSECAWHICLQMAGAQLTGCEYSGSELLNSCNCAETYSHCTHTLETDVPRTLGIRITGIRIAVGTAHICIYVRPACVRCAHPRQLQCWPFSNSHAQPIHGLIPAEWAVQLPTTDAIAEFQLRTHAYACICTRYSATMTLRALGDSRSSPALGRMHMEGIT